MKLGLSLVIAALAATANVSAAPMPTGAPALVERQWNQQSTSSFQGGDGGRPRAWKKDLEERQWNQQSTSSFVGGDGGRPRAWKRDLKERQWNQQSTSSFVGGDGGRPRAW